MFAILNMPHSIVVGGIGGTMLSYLLRQQGVSTHAIANQYTLLLLPGSLFFLWSPLTDFLLRRRTWMLVAGAMAGVCMTLALEMKNYAGRATVALLVLSVCLIYLASAALGGLVASLISKDKKTRVACFMQAGSLAGGAIGGGALLWLAEHWSKHALAVVAGAAVFAPLLLAFRVNEAPVKTGGIGFGTKMLVMGREFKRTFLRWGALPAVLLLAAPMGSGGAIGILSSIAKDYGVSANQVAWTNGLAGAGLTLAGALAMTLVPARFDIRRSYTVVALLNAAVLGVFCFGTPRPWMYLTGSVLYLFTVGACWAMYSALVLKIVGAPGCSSCGRYAMGVSIANLPVAYMAALDGWGAKWFGPKGLPGIDMVFSGVVALAFLGWFWWERVSGFEVEIGLAEELPAGVQALGV